MDPVPLLLVKALVGGLGVVAFAAVARMARPNRFAGLFCAAPSVAVGSLAVVVLVSGQRDGVHAAQGMIVGAAALVVACLVGALVAKPADGSALPISAVTSVAWLAAAALLALVVW